MAGRTVDAVDRIVGATLGQAVGDAVGFPVERMGPAACAAWAAARLRGEAAPARRGHAFGRVSDDTQCTLALMGTPTGSLAEEVRALAALLPEIVGAGRNTREALTRLREAPGFAGADEDGVLALLRGRDVDGAPANPTNGAAMRAWAHCVPDRPPEAMDAAVTASSRITHAAPASAEAAVEVAEVARLLMHGVAPAGVARLARASLAARGRRADGLAFGLAIAALPAADARAAVRGSFGAGGWDAVSPHATGTVAWAVRALARGGGDFGATLTLAMEGGGDVDTASGIAGAWCGMATGPEALPASVVGVLTDGRRDAAAMREVARGWASRHGWGR